MSLLSMVAELAASVGHGTAIRLADPAAQQRFSHACETLAGLAGAQRLLLFCLDPEAKAYLPAPPFPQTLPKASSWRAFLDRIQDAPIAAELVSPYSGELVPVCARRVMPEVIAVLLNSQPEHLPDSSDEFWQALEILGAIFLSAFSTRNANAASRLAIEAARQTDALATNLLVTRQKLESSLAQMRQERQRLEQTNQKLLLAQQIASMGTWEYMPQNGRLDLSPELYRILSAGTRYISTLDDLLGLIHEEDAPKVKEAIARAIHSAKPGEVEFRLREDGPDAQDVLQSRFMSARMVLGTTEEGQQRLLGVCLDVTQHRRSEEALRRSEALASAGRLAATIAHEVNNPLAGITNLLYLITLDVGITDSGREYLAMAEKEIMRLSHIARQTLAFYRDTSAPVDVGLEDLLAEILDLYHPKLRQHTVTVKHALPEGWRIRAYRGELKQLFSNLIANSIDAMEDEPGELILETVLEDDGICVTIRDTGSGISEDHITSLFRPFFTTKSHTGTGLGLWVSEGIARKHGGGIEVSTSTDPVRHGTSMAVHLAGLPPTQVRTRPDMESAPLADSPVER